jgi:hypothetical protein
MLRLLHCVCAIHHPTLPCLSQYLELSAEGPDPQTLQETLSKLIHHLSGPSDGSSSSSSDAVLAFEEDMLLQLFNARVATAAGVELTTQQQSAAQSLSQFFQVTKAASDRNQRVTLQTKLQVGESRCCSACTYKSFLKSGLVLPQNVTGTVRCCIDTCPCFMELFACRIGGRGSSAASLIVGITSAGSKSCPSASTRP